MTDNFQILTCEYDSTEEFTITSSNEKYSNVKIKYSDIDFNEINNDMLHFSYSMLPEDLMSKHEADNYAKGLLESILKSAVESAKQVIKEKNEQHI